MSEVAGESHVRTLVVSGFPFLPRIRSHKPTTSQPRHNRHRSLAGTASRPSKRRIWTLDMKCFCVQILGMYVVVTFIGSTIGPVASGGEHKMNDHSPRERTGAQFPANRPLRKSGNDLRTQSPGITMPPCAPSLAVVTPMVRPERSTMGPPHS